MSVIAEQTETPLVNNGIPDYRQTDDPKPRKLTKRQAKFVEAMVDPSVTSQAEAARIAGYKESEAHIRGSQNIAKSNIQQAIEIEQSKLREEYKERRQGLLNDVDEVKARIEALEVALPIESPMQTQLVAKRQANIDLEAKLTGAYTNPQENTKTILAALNAYNLWLEKNPGASLNDKLDAIKAFAAGTGVDEATLKRETGVEEIATVQ